MKTELYRSFEGKLDVGNEEGYIIYSIGGGRPADRTLQRMDTRPAGAVPHSVKTPAAGGLRKRSKDRRTLRRRMVWTPCRY